MHSMRSAWIAMGGVWALLVVGCSTTSEYNPFASVSSYETIVIEDFGGPGRSGYEFAERVAQAFASEGIGGRIVRSIDEEGRALRVQGVVTRYSRGNAAMRLRYRHNIGNARFAAKALVTDNETGELIARVYLNESYDAVRDRSQRIHQDLDVLAERAAQVFAKELAESSP